MIPPRPLGGVRPAGPTSDADISPADGTRKLLRIWLVGEQAGDLAVLRDGLVGSREAHRRMPTHRRSGGSSGVPSWQILRQILTLAALDARRDHRQSPETHDQRRQPPPSAR